MALKSFNKSYQENLGVEKNLQRTTTISHKKQ